MPRDHSASCLRESSSSAFLNFTVACAAAQRSAVPCERRTRGAKACKLGARLLDHGVRLWPLPEVRQLQQRAAPPRQGLRGAACQAELPPTERSTNRLMRRRPREAHVRVLVVARVILLRLLARLLEKHEPAGMPVRPSASKRARNTASSINGAIRHTARTAPPHPWRVAPSQVPGTLPTHRLAASPLASHTPLVSVAVPSASCGASRARSKSGKPAIPFTGL